MLDAIGKKARDLYWELTFLPTESESELEFHVNRWRRQLKDMISKIEDEEARSMIEGQDT